VRIRNAIVIREDDDIRGAFENAAIKGERLALQVLQAIVNTGRVVSSERLHDVACVVGGIIIDYPDIPLESGCGSGTE
jgi:hypothetical protein